MKAILVGRHTPDMGDEVEVVEQRAVNFPLTADECVPVLKEIEDAARGAGAEAVLLQNTPGQVAVALARQAALAAQVIWTQESDPAAVLGWGIRWGVIVSVPGERPGKVSRAFASVDVHAEIEQAVRFANPRAAVEFDGDMTWTVTVDGPPMPFEFSHIEWLRGYW